MTLWKESQCHHSVFEPHPRSRWWSRQRPTLRYPTFRYNFLNWPYNKRILAQQNFHGMVDELSAEREKMIFSIIPIRWNKRPKLISETPCLAIKWAEMGKAIISPNPQQWKISSASLPLCTPFIDHPMIHSTVDHVAFKPIPICKSRHLSRKCLMENSVSYAVTVCDLRRMRNLRRCAEL